MRWQVLARVSLLLVVLYLHAQAAIDHKEWQTSVSVGQSSTSLYSMTVDRDGNTYLVGTCRDSLSGYDDWLTVKLNSQGTVVWTRRLPSIQQTYTVPSGIAADSSGNVYEVGRVIAFDTVGSYLLKYSTDGTLQWHRYLNSEFGYTESVAVDHSGRIIVAGTEWHGKVDFRVAAYDAAGTLLWKDTTTNITSLGNFARFLRIGQDNSIYVVGLANGNAPIQQADSGDVIVAKYLPAGSFEWSARLDVGHLYNQPVAMAVDSQGNVAVISTGLSSAHSYSTIAKYLADGSLSWSQGFCYNAKCDTCTCNSLADALAADANGVTYVLGRHSETSTYSGPNDVVSEAISPAGNILWKHAYPRPPFSAPYYYTGALRLDPAGNLNFASPIQENQTSDQIMIVKAGPSGDTLWTALIDMGSTVYLDPRGLEVNVAGDITAGATWTANGTASSHILVVKFSADCCVGTRGNVNGTGIVDLSDLSLLIKYLTLAPEPVLPCPDEANVNATGIIDVTDLALLIAYLTANPKPTLPGCQ